MNDKNLIIGTAGHIDHGKTTLIKALTGADTDRLQQEKERGISIELGFTSFKLSNENQVGIIDVPGHEKFIKNMLAGAAGVDLAILVVAADEGMMPQSKEHLAILDLLGVKHGVVALTKTDKVDAEWQELVLDDTREKLAGSFLEEAKIIPVSAVEKNGIDALKAELNRIIKNISTKKTDNNTYFPIDRVFTLKGFGTIVTGTLFRGVIEVEDELELYPQSKKIRVRSLQVHNDQVQKVYPGQRVGINISGIDKDELQRGDVLAEVNSLFKTKYFEANLKMLKDLNFVLKNGDQIRFHIGAKEIIGRVYIYDQKQLFPEEEAYVLFSLEEEIAAFLGEKFVIRRYSPMDLIGGGRVIIVDPPPRKRNDKQITKMLKKIEAGDWEKKIEIFINSKKYESASKEYLLKKSSLKETELKKILSKLEAVGKIICLKEANNSLWIHVDKFAEVEEQIFEFIASYHQKNHLEPGISKEELRSKIKFNFDNQEFNKIIKILISKKLIKEKENALALFDFEISFNKSEKELKDRIIKEFKMNLYTPPSSAEIKDKLDIDQQKEEKYNSIINYLILNDVIIRLNNEILIHSQAVEGAEKLLKEYLEENSAIELGEFRDLIESSRKYALALLKKFEKERMIKKNGDKRVLFN
ncbi:MAG: selenocysteine-specific elongation factor SelB [Halanaerobium sp. 4-GBenrich]|jgi:selenocysteine-specific elongation factor|uniref:Selenocysteine-specific elongation factor n=1 Tax=Halanaerobium congolense TaxID=54121 RepID=A0A1G6PPW5_9FIRM|nr:selenocysteine-specific translation elongation factor [Halanaerobium congolense]ODS50486.1 MAG: selenocysteine-specific elongation factor SelB [Halanaerobium sp. 4-GBenrich]SDC82260.1 selenocysteine-specific elongation factor [Halanaerobium congolense]SDK93806.1 selenocysteine-specific elongation factor [Halanaerobium congolense]SDM86858.1 selenocysteine-specific elongation factor [Halanaerobium congolense]